mmetsp:Transcript_49662/g.111699  ORF Transcript_49662/g.111699 Transcript_49662/m.111699 type:complete len:427 (+) Transcript_49662:62-1342(+)
MAEKPSPRIAVIGAGPIGLEMAHGAMAKGFLVDVFEQAAECAGHVASYHFVRLFSPWSLNMTDRGRQVLQEKSLPQPDQATCPSGQEYRETYLKPLAEALDQNARCTMHYSSTVTAVGRGSLLKGESIGGGDMCMPKDAPLCRKLRRETPFKLLVRRAEGQEEFFEGFDVVADCTGVYRADCASWSGSGGVPALGERNLRSEGRIFSTIPDACGKDRGRFSGKRAMVVGTGMSAATAARDILRLAEEATGTTLTWVTRKSANPFTVIEDDVLPQRKALCELGNSAASGSMSDKVKYIGSAGIRSIDRSPKDTLLVSIETVSGIVVEEVDEFISACGFRPDASLYQELQVHQCYASEGPMKLAATLIGGSGDCLAQVSAGVDTLKSPEPGFFILGHKSYGRNSAFLLKIGFEQVQAVLEDIAPLASL